MAQSLIPVAVFLPLLGFLINGLLGPRINNERLSALVGCVTVGASFAIAVSTLFAQLALPAEARSWTVTLFRWIAAGSFSVDIAYQVDQLSILMMLIVTGVGFLIHVYSAGYMHGDAAFWRFFAYLNLFIFAMLNLVMAANFLLMFLGWEGVGLCSYLLIGFWYDRKFEKGTTADAAKKAFIVNRIGDVGFLIAMFLLFQTFGTLNFEPVFSSASAYAVGTPVFLWISLSLFLGATGKSAQIPLFVWLPDAMAGPTPVSALIHAATMVTAGVYMLARCSVLFALAPAAMNVVAVIGVATAVFAATIGLVQNDIKKVLAYSTISQLGYMFFAMGIGAFSAGMFHVMTHAFFKALLFLGSGAVIHAMHEEQNIQVMGGLRSSMPVTSRTFLVGTLAIAGIPPLSGFVSKDEILWRSFQGGHVVLWALGLAGAFMTAMYMMRLYTLTFNGQPRWEKGKHPHEAPLTMTVPLIVLAVLSVVGGALGWPASLGGGNTLEHWLEPVFARAEARLTHAEGVMESLEYVLMGVSIVVALGGILLARRWYLARREIPGTMRNRFAGPYKILLNKYYVDEIYDATVVTPVVKGSEKILWKGIDTGMIDWCINAGGRLVVSVGSGLRHIQTGVARSYVLVFVAGVFAILGWILLN